jgi:inorganic pyrophosphatase
VTPAAPTSAPTAANTPTTAAPTATTVAPTVAPTKAAPTATVAPTATTAPTKAPAPAAPITIPLAAGLTQTDETTITSPKNFVTDYAPVNPDKTLNFVVEIPTGTNGKWEVASASGTKLAWEIKDGKPRVINYLGYVGNYGMIPQTKGGDGDTLDVLAIGPALPRGAVVQAKLLGVLKYREDDAKTGPEDDKLLAILPSSPIYKDVNSLKDLDEKYPEISAIVKTWFNNYKGPGKMFFQKIGDVAEAQAVLDAAIKSYGTTKPSTETIVAAAPITIPLAAGLTQTDETIITSPKNFVTDYAPTNPDKSLNFVVEIPTGTNGKWEVASASGTKLAWEIKDGKPRVINYLGYVGNYGMIPQTKGGDGDTLDVLAIGPALPRGAVVQAKLLGVLKYREDDAKTGPEDDKLLAILSSSPIYNDVNSLKDLDEKYPEISAIVKAWFNNYKGPGKMFFQQIGDVAEAQAVLDAAIKAYTAK